MTLLLPPLALISAAVALAASSRSVAITIDDLPYVAAGLDGNELAQQAKTANDKLLAALKRHHVPVIGFVNQKRVQEIGTTTGTQILQHWIRDGLDLGNHTYSHADFNALTIPQFEDEIINGEATFAGLMKQAGKQSQFFRFPFNHTGDTKEKHDTIQALLERHGYKVATCTIDTSDYVFNRAYALAVARHDKAAIDKLQREYLAYSSLEIDYYAQLNTQVIGYEPPEVMLLHDNRLNADTMGQILALFTNKGYNFISLEQAQSDPVYREPDTYITKYGFMWGYRWAAERGIKVNGRLEPDVPKWIETYPGLSTPTAGHQY